MRITSIKSFPVVKSALVAMIFASAFKADVTLNGTATYYDVGLGSCGGSNGNEELVCALGFPLYDRFKSMGPASNGGSGSPLCSKKVTVVNAETGKSVVVTVVDRCECPLDTNGIDLSRAAFQQLGSLSSGRLAVSFTIHGVGQGGGSGGGGYGAPPNAGSPYAPPIGPVAPVSPPTPPQQVPSYKFKAYNYNFTNSGNPPTNTAMGSEVDDISGNNGPSNATASPPTPPISPPQSPQVPPPNPVAQVNQTVGSEVGDASGNNGPSNAEVSPLTPPTPPQSPQVPPPNPVTQVNQTVGGPSGPAPPQTYDATTGANCTSQPEASIPPPSLNGGAGASVARCEGNKVVYPQAEGSTLQPFVQECANGLTCQARGPTVTCA